MLAAGLLFILLVALAAAGFVLYMFWWRIQRPVPKLSEDAIVSGLEANVEIVRDRHGIPHIYAESDADLFRALGFVHAQERLWQMEQRRRLAHGRLAEVFGEPAMDADRFSRTIGFSRLSHVELETMGQEDRQILEQ